MNNKTIGIAVIPEIESFPAYTDSNKLIERLKARIEIYENQMLKIEKEDINFLDNRTYINLNAFRFQLHVVINLIKLNMI